LPEFKLVGSGGLYFISFSMLILLCL
jgi:hypothetical protein